MAAAPCQFGYTLNSQGVCVPIGGISYMPLYLSLGLLGGGFLVAYLLGKRR